MVLKSVLSTIILFSLYGFEFVALWTVHTHLFSIVIPAVVAFGLCTFELKTNWCRYTHNMYVVSFKRRRHTKRKQIQDYLSGTKLSSLHGYQVLLTNQEKTVRYSFTR